MSNYLDHLIARHFDRSTVVQPRLSSLFEPPQTAAVQPGARNIAEPLAFDAFTEERGDVGPVESRGAAEASFHSDVKEPHTQASPNESLTTGWPGRQRIVPSSLADMRPIEPAKLFRPAPVQPHPLHAQAATVKLTNEQSTSENTPSSLSHEGHATPLQNVRNSARKPELTAIAPADVQNDARAHEASLHRGQPGVEASPVDSTRRGIVVSPRIAARFESRDVTHDAPSPSSLTDPQPAPTIHVTIGRVEVRAMLPATSPRKQSPPTSLMGLNEYLRKRTEGDGR
jgi:hypothetical protein